MPLEALSANASEIVPVGAIESRWLLRMPCWRISFFSFSGRREAKRGAARYCSASNSGKAPFSCASPTEAAYASSRMTSAIFAPMRRASSVS